MSRRMKKRSGAFKYFLLIVLLVVLVVLFYLTNDDEIDSKSNDYNNPSEGISSNIIPNNNPSNEPSSKPSDNPSNPHIIDNTGTISGGSENIDVNSYDIYDKYIIVSDETTYAQSGYKYFIVRSYSEFEKYINTNLVSPFDNTYISKFETLNENTINDIKNSIDEDFFKSHCIIFVVDYSSKEIKSTISNIEVNENTASITIDRTIDNENVSKYITHLIPINSNSIRNVQINYIR